MKLRNKKTGEIADLSEGFIRDTYNGEMIQIKPVAISNKEGYIYASLAELNEEWEDYEEPKEYWYIENNGDIDKETYGGDYYEEKMQEIGNYFETKEEAEEAVEKLKALTEAKEDGLKIKGYYYNHEDLVILADIGKCNKLTLDTLFGKEID